MAKPKPKEPEGPKEPAQKKCTIEQMLPPNLIELLKMAPENPILRGLIMKHTNRMPPDKEDTFEKIKEWIEYNCESKKYEPVAGAGRINTTFNATLYRTVEGTARVARTACTAHPVTVTEEEILNIAMDALKQAPGMGRGSFMKQKYLELVNAKINAINPGPPGDGQYSYQNYPDSWVPNDEDEARTWEHGDGRFSRMIENMAYRYPQLYNDLFNSR